MALYAGSDGLDFIRFIIDEAERFVRKGGFVILEIGQGQAVKITSILSVKSNISLFYFEKDLFEVERFVVFQLK